MKKMFERFSSDYENVWHLFSETNDGLIITDDKRRIIIINPAFENISGYSSEELFLKNPSVFQSGQTSQEVFHDMWSMLSSNRTWTGELINRRKNGEIFYSHLTITYIKNSSLETGYYIGICRDVTKEKEEKKRIVKLAYYDFLTKLPNRAYFEELAKDQITMYPGERMALLFLDLNQFKLINDTLGHFQGDLLLKELVNRLKVVFGVDGLISRFGGDEFLILLKNVKSEKDVTEKLNACFSQLSERPFILVGQSFFLTVSIGVSLYPEHGSDVEALIKNAGTAMHQAKMNQRNSYQFFAFGMETELYDQLVLGNELRQALEKGQFELYYQLQMDVQKESVLGVEALIRWNHPVKGVLLPGEFLGKAEEFGLIEEIDNWVMTNAFYQTYDWHQNGYPNLNVSVNISNQQFESPLFIERVKIALKETNINPTKVCLEITEKIALNDLDEAVEKLKQLNHLGVKVALDDFGTGHSSLSQLKNFPVDILKIDRSFIMQSTGEDRDAEFVKIIIHMAKHLNYDVVCEGVETESQLNFLRNEACDFAQGYLFSRPLDSDQLQDILPLKS